MSDIIHAKFKAKTNVKVTDKIVDSVIRTRHIGLRLNKAELKQLRDVMNLVDDTSPLAERIERLYQVMK